MGGEACKANCPAAAGIATACLAAACAARACAAAARAAEAGAKAAWGVLGFATYCATELWAELLATAVTIWTSGVCETWRAAPRLLGLMADSDVILCLLRIPGAKATARELYTNKKQLSRQYYELYKSYK